MWSSWPWVRKTPLMWPWKRSSADVHPEAAIVERHPAVDEEHLAALDDGQAVHPDLAQATERDQLEAGVRRGHEHRVLAQDKAVYDGRPPFETGAAPDRHCS